MKTVDISEDKSDLIDLLRSSSSDSQTYRVASGRGNLVVMSEEAYDNLVVTLEFLMTAGLCDGLLPEEIVPDETPDLFRNLEYQSA